MVYSSFIFVFVFLPVVVLIYFGLSKLMNPIYQKLFLIGASLFFYGFNNIYYLPLIMGSVVVNYLVARILQKKSSLLVFIMGTLFNIFVLGYFKYFDFFIANANFLFKTSFALRYIVLPLGISFFTFQQLSFLVSIYKKEERVGSFVDYSIFVTFFPQLVAGPIVLYSEMMPQFKDEARRYFCAENFGKGFYSFCIGLFKKAVIADTLSLFVDNGYALPELGLAAGWVVMLSYTLQIYFDFSGYSDMAIGLGKMFNIDIPENFKSPYLSESITTFWRSWHITLGRALSTYVYKPLGGNRKGSFRTCLNLFITFFISGLWHGAAWTFVLWGCLHGMLMIIERLAKPLFDKIPRFIRIAATFLATNLLWVLFRASSFEEAMRVYRSLFKFGDIGLGQMESLAFDSLINFPAMLDMAYIIAILVVLLVIVFACKGSYILRERFTMNKSTAWMTAICFVVAIIHFSRGSVFIYFNF